MKTNVTISMDQETRDGLKELSSRMGITLSALLNMSAKQMVYSQRVEFDFSDLVLTPEQEKMRDEALEDYRLGRNYVSEEELDAFLDV